MFMKKLVFLMGMNIVFYCICYVLLWSAPYMMTNEFSLNNDTYQKYIFLKIQHSALKCKNLLGTCRSNKRKLNRHNELCYPFSISSYISEIHSHELDSLQILIKQFIFVIVKYDKNAFLSI